MSVFCQCGFFSESLGRCVSANVIIPEAAGSNIGIDGIKGEQKKFPVLYLLHGLSDDHSIWSRRTAVELYAASCKCIIVMADGGRSFYRNKASGERYKDFFTSDLINFVENTFPALSGRENRFICGLSMGGYGALALGMEFPGIYSKIAAFSSVADIKAFAAAHLSEVERKAVFGSSEKISDADDLFELSKLCVNSPHRPEIFLACGTEDFLYDCNVRFRQHLNAIGYPFEYVEKEGVHNWFFWDEQIRNALKFFIS